MMRMIRSRHLLPVLCLAVVVLFALSTPGERVADEGTPPGSARHALKFDVHVDAGHPASEWVAAEGDARVRDVKPTAPAGAATPLRNQDESTDPGTRADRPTALTLQDSKPLDRSIPLNRNHPQVANAINVQERHMEIMAHPAVVAMAVGLNGMGELAIVIYTKFDGADLPEAIEDIPVDVRNSGQIFAGRKRAKPDADANRPTNPLAGETSNAERWARPVPIGVSTGHPDVTAGTIACRLTDGTDVYALSNNHIYANQNDATIGDDVIQPGDLDGGSLPDDKIGDLHDFKEIKFGGNPNKPRNDIDAAVALTTTDDLSTGTPSTGGYGTPSSMTVPPEIDMGVRKVGRTTGDTTGTVDAINAIVRIHYSSGMANYHSQIIIVPGSFSADGDSGSLIVTDDANNNPVGLLFAGSSSHTIGNEIKRVLDHFNLTVDDTPPSGNAAPVVTITTPVEGANPDSGEMIEFTATATDEEDVDATLELEWYEGMTLLGAGLSFSTTLSDGDHTIRAETMDSDGATGSASVSITVGTSTEPTEVIVESVTYATQGGKNGDKHLLITVALVDDLGDPVAGASVSVQVDNTTTGASGTATTGSGGSVTFSWKNAPSDHYETTVTAVDATGLTWDEVTPANFFDK